MKSRLLVAAVAFLGYAILDATPANAEDTPHYYTSDSEDAWADTDSWDDACVDGDPRDTIPADGDSIIICSGTAVNMAETDGIFNAGNVTVEANATLRTNDDSLRLSTGDTLSVPGTLDVDSTGDVLLVDTTTPPVSRSISGTLSVRTSGTLDVTSGQLWLEAGTHSISGALVVRADATLDVRSGQLWLEGTGTRSISGELFVRSNGALDVRAGTLMFDNTTSPRYTIDGSFLLSGSTSKLSIDGNGVTLEGTGTLTGSDTAAEIEIQSGDKLINDMRIEGYMKIDASVGTFQNGVSASDDDGRVLANGSGTLDIMGTTSAYIVDYANNAPVSLSVYRWGVDGSAVLQFNQDLDCDSNELHGDFYVHDGIVRIGLDPVEGGDDFVIHTTGDLLHDGGSFEVGENDSISFNVVCPQP